jgi:hypothetical protein
MKKVLLGTTALLGAGLLASPAFAADGIKLSVGGFFNSAYMLNFDDDGEGEPGDETNTDNFFSDAEVHFTGEVTLDNGLTVGARIELEGETAGDQIDEAYVYWSGGFGEVRIGSDDDALAASCIVPPGGTGNFSAFSPNQWASNAHTSNSVCSGVDDKGDAQKLVYISPNFSGFQLVLSYTPDGDFETQSDGAGPHLGMSGHAAGSSRHNFSAYGSYNYEGDGWGLGLGAGGSWEGHVEQVAGEARPEQDFYQGGMVLTFGSFSVGGAVEYYNDVGAVAGFEADDALVWGGGASYNMDAWTIGVQGSVLNVDQDNNGAFDHFTQRRIVLTGDYAMGPGINIDAEVGYTWSDADGEDSEIHDDYNGVEIGIGSRLRF